MNFLFGTAGALSQSRMELFVEGMKGMCAPKYASAQRNGGSAFCAYAPATSPLIGRCHDEQTTLAFLGNFQQPLPNWDTARDPKNAAHVAAYLLQRYHQHETAFLDDLIGGYTLFLQDARSGAALLAADPYGIKRVFYRLENQTLSFSTNLVSLKHAFVDGLELDRSFETFLLGYEFLPWNRTIFKDGECLPQGTLLEVAANTVRRHKIALSRVEDGDPDTAELSEQQAIKALYPAFMDAVQALAPNEREVAVLLGGFDSALVAAALSKLGKRVTTFSYGFSDVSYRQAYTEELASTINATHVWVPIGPADIEQGLNRYESMFNQVSCQAHYMIPLMEMAKQQGLQPAEIIYQPKACPVESPVDSGT